MTDWMGIESAPKDGSRILLYCGRWLPPISCGEWRVIQGKDDEGNVIYDGSGFQTDWSDYPHTIAPFAATHWMPLPPIPEKSND